MTRFAWGAASDTGRVRTGNEDYVLAAGTLFAVADGMGGHSGGEIASHLAIESVMRIYDDGGRHTTDALVEAVQQANDALVQRAEREPDLKGMGTTICALALVDGPEQPLIGVINVGDSRMYLLKHEGELEQITEDHSLVATLERQGRITKAEAAVHPQRNIITRALGIDISVMVDSWEIVPFVGDRYLLCSDGLYNEVDDAKVAATLRRLADPGEAARELVRLANESGGRDNISVVIADVVDDDHRTHPDAERVASITHGSERVLHTAMTPVVGAAAASGPGSEAGATTSGTAEPSAGPSVLVDAERDPATAVPGGAVSGGAVPGGAVSGGAVSVIDPAGDGADTARGGRRGRHAAPRRRVFTWRLVLFLVALVLVLGVAFLTVTYVGTRTYHVGVHDDEVVIFQGRPGGVLWIQPELEEGTDVSVSEVPADVLGEIESGKEQATLHDARAYVSNLKQRIDEIQKTTTTTTTSTTSTTAPAATEPPVEPAAPGDP